MTIEIHPANVAVVIPSQKSALNPLEIMSVRRAGKVFDAYDIWLAAPRSMDESLWRQWLPAIRITRFDDCFFTSLRAYSHLCRMMDFYARFERYQYILIYQADCYVFRDELLTWCRMGYDYIGAPWLNYEFQTKSNKRWVRSRLLRPFLRKVGNGGFSLRRVETLRAACYHLRWWIWHTLDFPEDVFWSNIAPHIIRLRIPDWRVALQFAFDTSPAHCLKMNQGHLPFGCHAWNTDNLDFWRTYIPCKE